MAEEAIVEKRPVVKEEFVIRKRVVRDTQPVEADLRRERIDVQQRQDEAARDRDRRPGEEPRAP
jgi:stress response protein YsnF